MVVVYTVNVLYVEPFFLGYEYSEYSDSYCFASLLQSVVMRGLEGLEGDLLTEIRKVNGVLAKEPRGGVGEHLIEVGGLKYNRFYGAVSGEDTGQCMILVSVGDEYPVDLVVSQRIKNPSLAIKSLPLAVPGLHEEAAADLMAAASVKLKDPFGTVVQLLLDLPSMQRSKQYYLEKIETFFQNYQEPFGMCFDVVMLTDFFSPYYTCIAELYYLGNSEKGTGNWCFKDGTISFQEIFNIYRRHPSVKCLDIATDCSYSGQWVKECAKTLDSLHIPPCGHRAREKGVMVRVFASCQHNEEAAEPCYSVEAFTVRDDRLVTVDSHQVTQQTPTYFDSTRLVCCRGPDSPCPKTTFQYLTWENAVDKSRYLHLVTRRERDRDMWYYLLLHRAGDAYHEEFQSQYRRNPSLRLSDWGYILESGEGQDPPQEVIDKVKRWTFVA